jgi:hypothetical protein
MKQILQALIMIVDNFELLRNWDGKIYFLQSRTLTCRLRRFPSNSGSTFVASDVVVRRHPSSAMENSVDRRHTVHRAFDGWVCFSLRLSVGLVKVLGKSNHRAVKCNTQR